MCVCVCACVYAPVWQCPGTLAGAGAAQSVQESRVLASSVCVLDRRTALPPTFGCQRIWGRPSENSGQHSTARGQGLDHCNSFTIPYSPVHDSAAFMTYGATGLRQVYCIHRKYNNSVAWKFHVELHKGCHSDGGEVILCIKLRNKALSATFLEEVNSCCKSRTFLLPYDMNAQYIIFV